MSRWSYAQLPLPLWVTATMTYVSVWWEVLFPLLVLFDATRRWALWFGLAFHVGIYSMIEVGWFSFYTMAYYGVWVPDRFWARWRQGRAVLPLPARRNLPEPATRLDPSSRAG